MSEHFENRIPLRSDAEEVVGVFRTAHAFEDAVDELLSSGFDRAELSMLASHKADWKARNRGAYRVQELEDDPTAPRAAYMENHSVVEGMAGLSAGVAYVAALGTAGMIVAADGALTTTYLGAAIAGALGGLLATVVARRIGGRFSREIRDQLAHGGIILWVAARDVAHKRLAIQVLDRHAAMDVHAHASEQDNMPAANPASGRLIDPFLPGARL